MLTTDRLNTFTRALDALVAEYAEDPVRLVTHGQPLLARLLAEPECVPSALPDDQHGRGGRALIHRHPAGLYSVWSMVFGAGHSTPIHDHRTWGLVGVWRGEEREEKYHRTDDGARPEHATLVSRGTTANTPGMVTTLVPSRDDIHRIWNAGDTPAWSVHVYGSFSGAESARTYDLATGRVTTWDDDPLATARLWGLPLGSPSARAARAVRGGERRGRAALAARAAGAAGRGLRLGGSAGGGENMTSEVSARPLGVLPAVPLSDAQARTLQVLADYDLSLIRTRLLGEGAMPSTWVDDAILEFRRYLALRALDTGKSLQMFSRQIDAVWHTALLYSRLYADFCQCAFGQFVHHDPAAAPLSAERLAAEWDAFTTAYERAFGSLPRLWQMARPTPAQAYLD